MKLAKKKQANAKKILRLNFCYLKIIHILHPSYYPKITGHILKDKQKNNCFCIHTISHKENEDENKNRSHRYDNNRPRSRHEYKYSKYKRCLSMMILILLSNI